MDAAAATSPRSTTCSSSRRPLRGAAERDLSVELFGKTPEASRHDRADRAFGPVLAERRDLRRARGERPPAPPSASATPRCARSKTLAEDRPGAALDAGLRLSRPRLHARARRARAGRRLRRAGAHRSTTSSPATASATSVTASPSRRSSARSKSRRWRAKLPWLLRMRARAEAHHLRQLRPPGDTSGLARLAGRVAEMLDPVDVLARRRRAQAHLDAGR